MKDNLLKIIMSIIFCSILITSIPNTSSAKEKIILAGDKNYPPYEFIDKDGEYVGFNIDIMKALSIDMGKEIKIIPMDWMRAHKELMDSRIDGIQGMSFNEERRQIYNFSDEYLQDSLVIFTLKENTKIHNISSLKGKKVAVQRYGVGAYILSDTGEIEVEFSDDLKESFHSLKNKKTDAILANKFNALYIIKELSMDNEVKAIAYDIAPTPYGIAFNKNNNELPKKFNESIKNIKANGTYQKIYEKWFGSIENEESKKLKKIIRLFLIFFTVIILIIIIIMRINNALKQEVKKRTKEIEKKNKQLLDSLIYKEQLINSMQSGLIILDKDGYITDINNKANQILGVNLSKEKEKFYANSEIVKYFDKNNIETVLKKQSIYNSLENKLENDKKNIMYSYDIYPFMNDYEENIGTLIIIRDITEIIMLREKLKQKDRLESLGLLVSSIAHEIRNPLTSIKNYIDLLPYKYDNSKFRNKITEQLPVEINRLNLLLTHLLEYSKPKQFKKEYWYVKKEIIDIISFLKPKLEEKQILTDINIKENLKLYSDKQQIRQVIINVVLNAIDSMEYNGKLKIYSFIESDKIKITIEDNGKGIQSEDIKKAFDPFFTTKKHGTGLGLSTSYTIMKEHNGDIKIKKLNSGTSVELIFLRLNSIE